MEVAIARKRERKKRQRERDRRTQASKETRSIAREEEKPRRPTVTELLQRYYPKYAARESNALSPHKAKVMALLVDCQTLALGGHWWKCQVCGNLHRSYNSCRDRHCSRCTGGTRQQWLANVTSWVLPVNYFHCVFTTPHELNPLIVANERAFYGLQFLATCKALTKRAADPEESLGGVQPGFQMMLHTWGQLMITPSSFACCRVGGRDAT